LVSSTSRRRVLFWAVLVLAAGLLLELGLRIVMARWLVSPFGNARLGYAHDRELGWFPIAGDRRRVVASRPFDVAHNRLGFRDVDHGEKRAPRILFIGDSFVWGFDVEQAERFTERLRERAPEWEIVNAGVSGYGTDQELLLLERFHDSFDPDLVVLVHCSNDVGDSGTNLRYGGYKPYFVTGTRGLELRGVPVPVSLSFHYAQHPVLFRSYTVRAAATLAHALLDEGVVHVPDPTSEVIREMQRWVTGRGARFAVGLVAENADVRRLCKKRGIPWVDLDGVERYPEHAAHWTPDGHRAVAERIHRFVVDNRLLPPAAGVHQ
jgi:lysophospholipase L1-like esterase